MIQDIGTGRFDNQYRDTAPKPEDIVLSYIGKNRGDSALVIRDTGCPDAPKPEASSGPQILDINEPVSLPHVSDLPGRTLRYLFRIDDTRYFLDITDIYGETPAAAFPPAGFHYAHTHVLREYAATDTDIAFAGMTGFHLYMWYLESRFCGKCGHAAVHDTKLRMMRCPSCGHMIFPKIAPAVIVGLRSGDSIMMTRYAGRDYKGRALLAGFCEIGETPEETVVREVMEEVGLKACNVQYYASQPWGFDANLLMGFFADVEGATTVTMDQDELASACFVPRDEIVPDPNLFSLTATMIEAFRKGEW